MSFNSRGFPESSVGHNKPSPPVERSLEEIALQLKRVADLLVDLKMEIRKR